MTTRARAIGRAFPRVDHDRQIPAEAVGGVLRLGEFYDGVEIPRAVVWHEFGVVSVKRQLVPETTVDTKIFANQIKRQRFRRLPIVPVPFRFAGLNVGSSHKGFFHQWVDALPRAWVLGQVDTPIDHLVISQKLAPEFHAIARRLANRNVRIWQIPRAVRVFTPSYLHLPVPFRQPAKNSTNGASRQLPTEYIGQFKRAASQVLGLGGRSGLRVYVSREHAAVRRFTNEEEVQSGLAKLGFHIAHLEKMTITEQAKLFNAADVVVAQHGAGLTNLMYCRAGTRLIEIFHGPSAGAHNLYRNLAAQFELVYEAMTLDGAGKDAEVALPLEAVLDIL